MKRLYPYILLCLLLPVIAGFTFVPQDRLGWIWGTKKILPYGGPFNALDTFTDSNDVTLQNHINDTKNIIWQSGSTTWTIQSNTANNNPGLGGEEVTNPGFTGNADGWDLGGTAAYAANAVTLTGNSAATNYVGQDNLWANNSKDDALIKLVYEITVNTLVGNDRAFVGGISGNEAFTQLDIDTSVGIHTFYLIVDRDTGTNDGIYFSLSSGNTGGDLTITSVSLEEVTLNEIFASDDLGITQGIFDVDVTIPTVNDGRAGLVLALDSVASPANYIEVFYNRDTGKVEAAKFVASSRTSLINTTATYSAGAQLRAELTISGSNLLVDVTYNGNTIGTQQTISDAGIVGNTRYGIMNVDSSNSLDNFEVNP